MPKRNLMTTSPLTSWINRRHAMRKITFSPDSIAEIAIANYIDQYEAENGKRCTKSYAINALIGYGDTFRIMLRQKPAAAPSACISKI